MSRKRLWYSADAQFTDDPKIADLGDAFGSDGPLAIVVLHGLAKLQDQEGRVASRVGTLARKAFHSRAVAERVLRMAAELDIVGDLEIHPDGAFELSFPHWDSWQVARSGADRQRSYKKRQRQAVEEGESTETDAEGEVIRRLFDLWVQLCRRDSKPQPKLTANRREKIRARLREGYSEETLANAIRGCAGSPFHRGENDRKQRYDELTLIFRNGENVERFAAMPPLDEAAVAARDLGPDPSGDDLAEAYA